MLTRLVKQGRHPDTFKNVRLETLRAFLPPLVARFELFSARSGLEKVANFWTRTEHFRNMGLSGAWNR